MGGPVIYLDASAIVPLFVEEARSADVNQLILGQDLAASPLSFAEASSAISRRVRMKELRDTDGERLFQALDAWRDNAVGHIELTGEDFLAATPLIRRFDLGLRTPDALHIAIAQRMGAKLLTFDAKMAAAAAALGVDVTP
jgi:predicted nucleic acid-binding protein